MSQPFVFISTFPAQVGPPRGVMFATQLAEVTVSGRSLRRARALCAEALGERRWPAHALRG